MASQGFVPRYSNNSNFRSNSGYSRSPVDQRQSRGGGNQWQQQPASQNQFKRDSFGIPPKPNQQQGSGQIVWRGQNRQNSQQGNAFSNAGGAQRNNSNNRSPMNNRASSGGSYQQNDRRFNNNNSNRNSNSFNNNDNRQQNNSTHGQRQRQFNNGNNNGRRFNKNNNRQDQYDKVSEDSNEDRNSNSESNHSVENSGDDYNHSNQKSAQQPPKQPPRQLTIRRVPKEEAQKAAAKSQNQDEDNEDQNQNSHSKSGSQQDDDNEDDYSQEDSQQQDDQDDDQYDEGQDDDDDGDDDENDNDNDDESYYQEEEEEEEDGQKDEQYTATAEEGENAADIQSELRLMEQMCHETVNESQFREHIDNEMKVFAFFEKDAKGIPSKAKSFKVHYRSAAGNQLEMSDILSPKAILKSTNRIINEILDYFLDKRITPRQLVDPLTDRLRSLSQEFIPLSKHLANLQHRKLFIEPKEKLLAIYIAAMNYCRRDSCLEGSQYAGANVENGYSEKKHFEQLETLSDQLFESYESTVSRIKTLISGNKSENLETLKEKIKSNQSLYLSPMIPKVIGWRMLISFQNLTNLHRMDDFLLTTHDSLISDPAFCAVFEIIMTLTKHNYYGYFKAVDTDTRLDYISANTVLLHLANTRFNYLLAEKPATYPDSLKLLRFDLDSKEGKESADGFLKRLGYSLKEMMNSKQGIKFDESKRFDISLKQNYWPNFYHNIEWRKPKTFKKAINDLFDEAEQSDFVDILLENLIRADRKMVPVQLNPSSGSSAVPQVASMTPVVTVKEINKPSLNLAALAARRAQIAEEEAQAAEKQRHLLLLQKQEKLLEKWQAMIQTATERQEARQRSSLINALSEQHVQDIYEVYTTLKTFKKWKKCVQEIKANREKEQFLAKFKNEDRVRYGLNNPAAKIDSDYAFFKSKEISSSSSSGSSNDINSGTGSNDNNKNEMEIEPINRLKESVTAIEKSQFDKTMKSARIGESSDLFERIARQFVRLPDADGPKHTYFKITIVADEQNPLIMKFVRNFSNYLSHEKMPSEETTFQITLVIDGITIEYTLQLQMAKYLSTISPRELSGSDLFIYVFNESDDRKNVTYFATFKQHLESLCVNKLSSGFNMLFVGVGEKTIPLQGNAKGDQPRTTLAAAAASNSNPFELIKQPSQPGGILSPVSLSHQNASNSHLGTSSNSIINQMITNFGYTNPNWQDSEGSVRQAIRYVNSRLLLKRDTESATPLIAYYNVVTYIYENIAGRGCVNSSPFNEQIFKSNIDGAIEKSIRMKYQLGVIRISSLSSELARIRDLFTVNSHRDEFKQIRVFLQEQGAINCKKGAFKNMNNFFYMKSLFNDSIFALLENFCSVIDQAQLIPFDQLSESDAAALELIESSISVIRAQLDKLFMKKTIHTMKKVILQHYYKQYSYENIVHIFNKYLANILDVSGGQQLDPITDSAFKEIKLEMEQVVSQHFAFAEQMEAGIVGNWQMVFLKLIDHLIEIFSDNDIPIVLTKHFKYSFDRKVLAKTVDVQAQKLNAWLSNLEKQNIFVGGKKSQLKGNGSLKRKHRTHSHDQALHLYRDILQYNEKILLPATQINVEETKKENKTNLEEEEEVIKMVSEGSVESGKSSEEEEDDDEQQDEVIDEQMKKAAMSRKRRTACLVPNSKEEALGEIKYEEKIHRLMRGEITGSPTKLDNSFV